MYKENKIQPADSTNDRMMVTEGLRPPMIEKSPSSWKNEIQRKPRKRRFFVQQTPDIKKKIIDILKSPNLDSAKWVRDSFTLGKFYNV